MAQRKREKLKPKEKEQKMDGHCDHSFIGGGLATSVRICLGFGMTITGGKQGGGGE